MSVELKNSSYIEGGYSMPMEELVSILEKKFLPIDLEDCDLDIDLLIIRRLKQYN